MVLKNQAPAEERPLAAENVDKPTPGPGEVLLRVIMCGVCRTDLHIVEGDLPFHKKPIIPGHQVVAEVEETGPGVENLEHGDRVGVTWLYDACGNCDFCREGLENLCDKARFTGYDADGGYAEYMTAPAAFVHPLPEGMEASHAAPLLCAGLIGFRSLRLSDIKRGGRLGLYGFGASAHVVIQVARHMDCEVYVFTRSAEHKEHARQLGAAWVGDAQDSPPHPVDSSVIFAPAGKIVPEALRVLKKGGIISINAIHMSPIPELDYRQLYYEKTIRSVANVTREDAREFLPLAMEIPVHTDIEVFGLNDANTALLKMKHSELNGAAVLQISRNG